MSITQKAEPFLVSHFFLPFDSISSKAMADFSIRSAHSGFGPKVATVSRFGAKWRQIRDVKDIAD